MNVQISLLCCKCCGTGLTTESTRFTEFAGKAKLPTVHTLTHLIPDLPSTILQLVCKQQNQQLRERERERERERQTQRERERDVFFILTIFLSPP